MASPRSGREGREGRLLVVETVLSVRVPEVPILLAAPSSDRRGLPQPHSMATIAKILRAE